MGIVGGQSGIWKALATHSEGRRGSTRGGPDNIFFCTYFFAISTTQKGSSHFYSIYPEQYKMEFAISFLFKLLFWGPPMLVQIADNQGCYPRRTDAGNLGTGDLGVAVGIR